MSHWLLYRIHSKGGNLSRGSFGDEFCDIVKGFSISIGRLLSEVGTISYSAKFAWSLDLCFPSKIDDKS